MAVPGLDDGISQVTDFLLALIRLFRADTLGQEPKLSMDVLPEQGGSVALSVRSNYDTVPFHTLLRTLTGSIPASPLPSLVLLSLLLRVRVLTNDGQ